MQPRDEPDVRPYVDQVMGEVAVPSETPLELRGWVADPREVMVAEEECEEGHSLILGGYHMHRVPWDHDPTRETCTEVDRRLAEGSGPVDVHTLHGRPRQPVLRAFFERDNDKEAPVRLGYYS